MNDTISLFTPETLDQVIKLMPPRGSFFKNTFFRNEKCFYTEKVRIEFKKGIRRVAPFINVKDKAKVVERIGWTSDEYTTPMVAVKDVSTIEDELDRLPGEALQGSMTPMERGLQMEVEVLDDFEDQIARREEWMCAKAMMEGLIPVVGEGVNYEIDFGFTNKSTVANLWDTSDNPTVYRDLDAVASICKKNGYHKPNVMIMEPSAYHAFLRATKLDEEFKQQVEFYNIMNVKPRIVDENVTFVGKITALDLEIYTYEEWVIDDWTDPLNPVEVPLMPKGKVLLASTNAKFSMYYGLLSRADSQTAKIVSQATKRMAHSWVNEEPAVRFLQLKSRPLPAPHEVDSWYVLTVSATE